METPILVWHRSDLRTADNPALAAAEQDGTPAPVFIIDPTFYENDTACDARLEFMHESLRDLHQQYTQKGSSLALRHGSATEVLKTLLNETDAERVYFNRETNALYGRTRDDTVRSWDATTTFDDDGIIRDVEDSREDWQSYAEAYFTGDIPDASGDLPSNPVSPTHTLDEIRGMYDVNPSKTGVPDGGRSAGMRRLRRFTDQIEEYVGGISAPAAAEDKTSHLSAYLKFGCLSPREVYQYVHENVPSGQARSMFTSRLFWNRHFTQKLEDYPQSTEHAINPVFRGMNRSTHDDAYSAAWKEGMTGFPLVDASMRALKQTGWLNFRMRAMCASFYTYILRCWWKDGADFFYHHLIDADSAINYQQWQMQSGLVGVHPIRIYNPMKQVRENDPNGEFIRRYVPELRDVPLTYLDNPADMPKAEQEDAGVLIGEDYPEPIVDFEQRAAEAREAWAKVSERAKEAMDDPEIRRRASLSQRGSGTEASGLEGEEAEEPAEPEQRTLDAFDEG